VILVLSLGERKGGFPWCFYSDSRFYFFEGVDMLLVGEDLSD
jgi:hypothetical protein